MDYELDAFGILGGERALQEVRDIGTAGAVDSGVDRSAPIATQNRGSQYGIERTSRERSQPIQAESTLAQSERCCFWAIRRRASVPVLTPVL